MSILKLALKIIFAPVLLVLTIFTLLLALALAVSTRVLATFAYLFGFLSLLAFLSGNAQNGGVFLLLAFLISPYGLPLAAEWLWKGIVNQRSAVHRFVFS